MTPRLRPVLALARREVLALWRAPRAYVLLAFYLFAQGFLFSLLVVDVGPGAFRLLARDLCVLWVLLGPAVASGCLAGDRSSGELATFLDAPVSERALVLGKALGTLGLLVPLVLGALLPAGAAAYLGAPAPVLAPALLGLALLALATTSAGVLASSLAAHPASATVLGVVLLLLFTASGIGLSRADHLAPHLAGGTPSALDPFWLLDGLFQGVIDSRPLLLFPAFGLLCLLAAAASLRAGRAPSHHLGVRTRELLRDLALPVVAFLLLHQVALRNPWTLDLSERTELVRPLVEAARELPTPLVLHRARAPGGPPHDALDDLLDAARRQAAGALRVRELERQVYLSRLRPRGLLVPPKGGVVLELADAVRHVSDEELSPLPAAAGALVQALDQLTGDAAGEELRIAVGHGEPAGLAPTLGRVLSAHGLRSQPVQLAALDASALSPEVPLLLVGPRVPLAAAEVALLRALLDQGGRLLLCLDPERPRLAEQLLPLLDLETEGGLVADPRAHLAGAGPAVLLAEPVEQASTRGLGRAGVLVPTALSLRPRLPGNPGFHPILAASRAAKRAPDLEGLSRPETWTFAGAWSAEAFPKGQLPQVLGIARVGPLLTAPYRAVVLGDADLFTAEVLASYPANSAFLQAVVSWLAERTASGPRVPHEVRSALSRSSLQALLHGMATLPAFLALLAGFLAWRRHRRRFHRLPRATQ